METIMKFAKKVIFISGVMLITIDAHASETTIYGYIGASIESAGATGSSYGTKPTQSRVSDNNSRIGFRGDEDLGDGVKTIWQIESSLRNFEQGGTTDWGQSATFGTRNTFIGFESSQYGKILAGYNDNAYKSMVGSVSDFGLDVMGSTAADNWGSGPGFYSIFSRGETRMKNSVHYFSPNLNGFQFGGSYGFDESSTSTTNTARYSLAAKYEIGGFKVGAGWDRQNDTALTLSTSNGYGTSRSAGKSINYYKLVTSYRFPQTQTLIGAGIERGSYDTTSGSKMSQNGWTVAASQPLAGKWAVMASYSKLGGLSNATSGSADDYVAKQWVMGTTYALSKRTKLMAYYSKIINGSLQNVNFGFNPETDATSTSDTAMMHTGNTLHVIGVGMGISF
jgi:predicted porin